MFLHSSVNGTSTEIEITFTSSDLSLDLDANVCCDVVWSQEPTNKRQIFSQKSP